MKATDIVIVVKDNVGFVMDDGETIYPWKVDEWEFLKSLLG